MRAFEVHLNGKRLCLAGIGDDGVLSTIVDCMLGRGPAAVTLRVGGLICPANEHVTWRNRNLRVGDEVRLRVVEEESVDRPRKRYRLDPAETLRSQKQYVRKLAKGFGWRIVKSRG